MRLCLVAVSVWCHCDQWHQDARVFFLLGARGSLFLTACCIRVYSGSLYLYSTPSCTLYLFNLTLLIADNWRGKSEEQVVLEARLVANPQGGAPPPSPHRSPACRLVSAIPCFSLIKCAQGPYASIYRHCRHTLCKFGTRAYFFGNSTCLRCVRCILNGPSGIMIVTTDPSSTIPRVLRSETDSIPSKDFIYYAD